MDFVSLQLDYLLLRRGLARIRVAFLILGTLCHVFGRGSWHMAHEEPRKGNQECPVLLRVVCLLLAKEELA